MALSLISVAPSPARVCAKSKVRAQRVVARAEFSTKDSTSDTTKETSTATEFDSEKLLKDLKAQWDGIEDKTSVVVYGVGAVTLIWLSSTIVGAINRVPLVPKLMELVGLAYTAWFVYRYLLFKESRKELISDVEELKKKISGDSSD